MSAHPLYLLEDLQARLARAQSLTRQIQSIALDTSTADATDELDMIEALADALAGRLSTMQDDAETVHRQLSGAISHAEGFAALLARAGGDA